MKQNPTMQLTKIPSADEIAQRFQQVGLNLLELARDVAAALDINPDLTNELAERGIARGVVHRLEKLGRGQIHESLVFNVTPGAERLLKLPLSIQVAALKDGVEVLEDDETSKRVIPVNELTPAQARQCFSSESMRSIGEQRTYLHSRKAAPAKLAAPSVEYVVKKDHVITTKPGKWSRAVVLQWLAQMS